MAHTAHRAIIHSPPLQALSHQQQMHSDSGVVVQPSSVSSATTSNLDL